MRQKEKERVRARERERTREKEKRPCSARDSRIVIRGRGGGEGERDIESVGKVTSASVSFECVNSRFDDRILENKRVVVTPGFCLYSVSFCTKARFNTIKM